jgi:hypothetical protein
MQQRHVNCIVSVPYLSFPEILQLALSCMHISIFLFSTTQAQRLLTLQFQYNPPSITLVLGTPHPVQQKHRGQNSTSTQRARQGRVVVV